MAVSQALHAALEQRITLWKQRGATTSQYVQEAELKDLRASLPEYAAIHSHVLQDVLARLEKTYRDFFRRVQARKAGEKGRPNARISTLSRAQPLQQFHLQGGWQWGAIR